MNGKIKIWIAIIIILLLGAALAFYLLINSRESPPLPVDTSIADKQSQGIQTGEAADPAVSETAPDTVSVATSPTTSPPSPTVPTPQEPPAGSIVETKEFTVIAQNYSFSPVGLSARKGDGVRIILKNAGGSHDLRIDEFNAATKIIQAGGEGSVEFLADRAGTFEYYCSVGNHRAMGMTGTLTITE